VLNYHNKKWPRFKLKLRLRQVLNLVKLQPQHQNQQLLLQKLQPQQQHLKLLLLPKQQLKQVKVLVSAHQINQLLMQEINLLNYKQIWRQIWQLLNKREKNKGSHLQCKVMTQQASSQV